MHKCIICIYTNIVFLADIPDMFRNSGISADSTTKISIIGSSNRTVYAGIIERNSCSVKTGMPSSRALVSLLPGFSPQIT